MKNETKFSDEEIQGILDKVNVECTNCSITTRQIMNMAKIVDSYSFKRSEDRILALEYATIIRSQILFYINHVVKPEKMVDYRHKQYITMDAITKRVIMTMYPERKFDLYEIDDKHINMIVDMILKDLQVELFERKEVKKTTMDEIHNSTLIRKKIIKKRLGL